MTTFGVTEVNQDFRNRIQVFDRSQPYTVFHRRLPHWTQAGTLCFITFRTWDSIPRPVLENWLAERDKWLLSHEIEPASADWQNKLSQLEPKLMQEFKLLVSDRWNDNLDACHGDCVLRNPVLSKIVDESLRRFDGARYDLTDWVVMPNHVHVLVAFPDDDAMLKQCESWKHFTATRINRFLGRKGRFWQQDDFDHL